MSVAQDLVTLHNSIIYKKTLYMISHNKNPIILSYALAY